jgi:PhnB protein
MAEHTYNSLQPYLMIKDCAAAMEFYHKAFGATERLRMPRGNGSVAHAEMQFGDTMVMMADENVENGAFAPDHYGGSPVMLHFYVEDCDATYKRALSLGAKSVREPADQPYGDRQAGVLDPFGYKWYVSTPLATK